MTRPPKQLLWVDDDNPMRFFSEIEFLEEDCGYQVKLVHNIQDATKQLNERPFDAIIMDQMLPFSEEDRFAGRVSKWGGCFLMAWLRGESPLDSHDWGENDSRIYGALCDGDKANIENKKTPILVISAIMEPGPLSTITQINEGRLPVNKPISGEEISQSLRTLWEE